MALPSNVEQLNIGQLVAALSQATATEFMTAIDLLRISNRGVDWRILLGAITAENSVVTADGAAAPNFAQAVEGLDRANNLTRFIEVDARGRLITVPPAADLAIFATEVAAAGAALAGPLVAALAGRTAVITSFLWCVCTGAAAQPALQLTMTNVISPAGPVVAQVAVPANDCRTVSWQGMMICDAVNTLIAGTTPATAANTTQTLIVTGFYV